MHILSRLFLSSGVLLCISAQAADNKPISDTETFNKIKISVFTKKSNSDFEKQFTEKYPNPTKAALFNLLNHIDKYDQGPKCWPPKSAIKIGNERIPLRGDIAIAIDTYFNEH